MATIIKEFPWQLIVDMLPMQISWKMELGTAKYEKVGTIF